jgi:hypothetical protein
MSKLNVKQFEAIRDADREKHSAKDLATKYGVSVARINEIRRGAKGNAKFPKALKPKPAVRKRAPRTVTKP